MGWMLDQIMEENPEFADECECGVNRGEHSLETVFDEGNFDPPLPLSACRDRRCFWGFSKTKKFKLRELRGEALQLVNRLRLSFDLSHLLSNRELKGYKKLHCVAIYLATGRRATKAQRSHI